ncbi:MAG: hemolysin family protein [Cytophagales bacterium]|nr:hemolysin family protein [Cytophagales bacterium]
MDFLLIVFLIVLNAAFSMSEMALTASRKALLTAQAETGDKGALAALALMTQPTRFLSSVQVGITSIGILNGIVGEAAFSDSLSTWLQSWGLRQHAASMTATAVVVTLITLVTIVFGELVPKRIGQLYPEAVARRIARPMQWVARLALPFVWLLTKTTAAVLALLQVDTERSRAVTHEEINANLDEGLDAGIIDESEHSLVQNVFDLDGRPLASLMLPRAHVVWLASEDSLQTTLKKVAQAGHSWYPVCDGDWAHVQGVVSVSQLLLRSQAGGANWHDLVQPVGFVPETLNAMLLLNQFKQKTERMALVVDEYGEVQGLITPQDLLQAITGELHTPSQGLPSARQQADGIWLLDGQLSVQELKNKLEIEFLPAEEDERYNTLGGLVMSELGDLPTVGSYVTIHNWRLEVVRMAGRRVDVVKAVNTREI